MKRATGPETKFIGCTAPAALLENDGSQGWIRTTDLTVNNRPLYR